MEWRSGRASDWLIPRMAVAKLLRFDPCFPLKQALLRSQRRRVCAAWGARLPFHRGVISQCETVQSMGMGGCQRAFQRIITARERGE